jgi:hypothetical protein
MNEVSIDRLSLRLSGLTPAGGRRLAERVADALAQAALPAGPGTLGKVRVTVAADAESSPDVLAEQVVAELLRVLGRTL